MDSLLQEDGTNLLLESDSGTLTDFFYFEIGLMVLQNYLGIKGGNGLSVTEKIR